MAMRRSTKQTNKNTPFQRTRKMKNANDVNSLDFLVFFCDIVNTIWLKYSSFFVGFLSLSAPFIHSNFLFEWYFIFDLMMLPSSIGVAVVIFLLMVANIAPHLPHNYVDMHWIGKNLQLFSLFCDFLTR